MVDLSDLPVDFCAANASNVATLSRLATQAINVGRYLRDRPTESRPFHFRTPYAFGARLWDYLNTSLRAKLLRLVRRTQSRPEH
jgi:hypothetical protein